MSSLFEKIYGCEAAGSIGNSMGEIMEGWTVAQRRERLGYVTQLLPVEKPEMDGRLNRTNPADVNLGKPLIYHGHSRVAGTTEDGEERHRLCATAIIEKQGRIDVADLARIWVRDLKPENFGYLLGPQDQIIFYALQAGIPPQEVGRYASWPGFYGTSKMVSPIGEVNACNPVTAAQDAANVGRLKDVQGVSGNYAIEVCSAYAAAVAEALKPDASVEGVIDTALAYLSWSPRSDAQEALKWADGCDNIEEYGRLFEKKYEGRPVSNAVEIFSAALGIFKMTDGNPKDAIIYGVNSGRDTDCRAHTAGSLSGALRGVDAVPGEWIAQVDAAMKVNRYTVSQRSIRESAEGLYRAALKNMEEMKKTIELMECQITGLVDAYEK